jgi:hypothetical protein
LKLLTTKGSNRLALALLLFAGVTCTESVGPRYQSASIGIAPVFTERAAHIYSNLVSGGLIVDNIHIVLKRADGTTIIDTVVTVAADQDSVVLDFVVPITGPQETLTAEIDLRDGTVVLFSGERNIVAVAGAVSSGPAAEIPIVFTGPGASVASIDIQPADTAIASADSVVYRPTAKDQAQANVADFALNWSVKTPAMGTVSANGVFKPAAGVRGETYVIAETYTDIKDSALVHITPPATQIVTISGNAQTGTVGGYLPNDLVIEARAADNLPVPNTTVNLIGPPGTIVLQITDKTDQNGRIQLPVPVGTIAGPIAFSVTSPGLTALNLTGTAVAGTPNKLAMSQEPSATAASGAVIATQPKVQLQDQYGNSAAVAGKAIVAAITTPAGRTLSGTLSVNTDANGVAAFTNLSVTGSTGSLTLRFTHDTLTAATSNAITLGAGVAAKVVLSTRPSATENSGDVLATQPVARISDAAGNTVTSSSASVTVTASAGYTLGGTATVAAGSGIVTFTDLAVNGAAGNALLTFTSSGLIVDTATVAVTVAYGAPASITPVSPFVFLDSIQANVSGANLPSVIVKDAGNIPVPDVAVTFRMHGGLGSLMNGSTDTLVTINTGADGIAKLTSWKLRDSVAVDTMIVTAAGVADTTVQFQAGVLNGNPHHLAVMSQPNNAVEGETIGVLVVVQDRLNNITAFLPDPPNVTLTIKPGTGTGGAALSPDTTALTQPAAAGVATFLVSIDLAGTGYVLTASSPVGNVETDPFEVTPAGPGVVSWINGAGGNWSVGANWSTGSPPSSDNIADISLAGVYAVTLDVDATVAGLVVGSPTSNVTLALASRTLTLNGESTVHEGSVLSLTTSSISGPGPLGNAGTVLALGASAINVAFENAESGTVRVRGQTSPGAANLTFATGWSNFGYLELTSLGGGYASTVTVTAGELTNNGEISSVVDAGGSRTIAAQLNNQGNVTAYQILTLNKAGANHLNGGTIDVTAGDLVVTLSGTTPKFTNQGLITVSASRNMSVSGGESDFTTGTVAGAANATLTISNSTLSFSTSAIQVALNLSGTSPIAGGAVTVADGETLTLYGGTLSATIDVQAGGTLLAHSNATITGAVTNAGDIFVKGQAYGNNALLTVANGFTNNGLIELTSGDAGYSAALNVTNGVLTNAVGATLHSNVGTGGSRTLEAQLDNQGTLDVDQPLALTKASAVHANSGAIDLTIQSMIVSQSGTTPSFTNTGAVNVGPGRSLSVTGGAVSLAGGTVTGANTATITLNTVTLDFTTASVTIPMTLLNASIVSGRVTIQSGETLTLLSGGLSDTVSVAGSGTLLTHGSVTLGGPVLTAVGATVRVQGHNNGGHATLTVANGFTNNGLIELTSADLGYTATLAVTTGVLVNAPGATIHSALGVGGGRTLATSLDNQGTLDVDAGLTLDKASASHTNSGSIDLTAADFTLTQSGGAPSFTNTGTVTLAASRTWTVNGGGTLNLSAGTVSGALTSKLVVTGATLAFSTSTVTIPLTLNATTTGGTITIPSGETLTLLGGGLDDPISVASGGTLLTHATVALGGALTVSAGATVRVQGHNNGGHATLTVANGFTNNGLIELTSADLGYTATLAVTTGVLVNAPGATIHSALGVGGGRTLATNLDNQGTLDVDAGLTLGKASASHTNSGTIDLTAADFTLTQSGDAPSFTNTGTVTLAAGRTWTVNGSGTLNLSAGTVSGALTSLLNVSGTALAFTPNTVTIPMTLNTTTIVGDSLVIGTSQLVTLKGGGLSNPVTIHSGGTLLTHESVALNAAVTMNGGTLRVQGQNNGGHALLTVANGFTNIGLIELTSADLGYTSTLAVTSGTLTNNVGAMIHSDVGTGGGRTIAADLSNSGTLDVDQPLTLDKADATHYNANTIDLTNANLTVAQTAAGTFGNGISGTIALGPSKQLTINGGTANFIGTSLVYGAADARLAMNGATLNFTPAHVTVPLALTSTAIAGGTVTIGSEQGVTLVGGNLDAFATVQSSGVLRAHGAAAVTSVAVDAGGLLEVRGQSDGGHASLTVANGFTNNGEIRLTSADLGYTSALNVTSGTLTNSPDATIVSDAGDGGARTLGAHLSNQGTLDVNQPLTLSKADANHSNSGYIDLTGASLTVTQTGTAPSFTNNGTIQLASGKTFTVSGGVLTNASGDPSGTIQGPGTINVSATAFTNHGNIDAGIGYLYVTGNYTQDVSFGGANYTISNGTLGTGYGQIVVSGTVTLAGSLNVSFNDFLPIANQEFTIMTFASHTGTFNTTNLPDLSTFGLIWDVIYGATDIKLKVLSNP